MVYSTPFNLPTPIIITEFTFISIHHSIIKATYQQKSLLFVFWMYLLPLKSKIIPVRPSIGSALIMGLFFPGFNPISSRNFVVNLHGFFSTSLSLLQGVPYYYVLGPLNFSFFIPLPLLFYL